VKGYVEDKDEHRDQKAMRLALLYPEPEKGSRGKRGKTTAETAGVSGRWLEQARQVLRSALPLALSVRDGITRLDAALEEVTKARKATASLEAMIERLREGGA
jgi:hypothetical protein